MGWNEGYSIFESLVVGLYDLGVLDKDVLSVILEPFRNTDADHGGSKNLLSKDNLNADEIVVKIGNPDFWSKFEKNVNELLSATGLRNIHDVFDKFEKNSIELIMADRLYDDLSEEFYEITGFC